MHQNLFCSSKKKLWTTANINVGKNNIFICSNVDSLTLEKGATHIAFPSQSYKKCNNVPARTVKANPHNCHKPTDLFIIPPTSFFDIILSEKGKYTLFELDNKYTI
jgi:hypothetical protein